MDLEGKSVEVSVSRVETVGLERKCVGKACPRAGKSFCGEVHGRRVG